MIIIYHCYGAAHSSILSAAIHLGLLPDNRVASIKEIKEIPYFDEKKTEEIGTPILYGIDQEGNKIYVQGMGGADETVINLLKDLMELYGIPEKDLILINALQNVNILVRIGGFLSRRLGFVFPGRIISIIGLQLAYPKFIEMVSRVKDKYL
ncbi:MAG TPA: DUF3189 family protein [Halanaerobiaceae bacterium]|jgi:hypothetical protein|nr:DUF3189 family protein [Bacillota bacterium]HHU93021.1 DUF3189 family protein [Halanaerobiaceae bacterium]HOA40213.1 DUF3189 family protein [Halanaerobiales bacterium]HPZ62366.1 DUF3189 family protein [Halanaerobiales bacterium]HQD03764.1 DUF3189 family protein [Halanaerobiales bacterium]